MTTITTFNSHDISRDLPRAMRRSYVDERVAAEHRELFRDLFWLLAPGVLGIVVLAALMFAIG